ncbi:MAG: hypothetical protein F4X35_03090 [Alphaproteobacteria bacterium]|nr:hypothetical protein [Alphaproteobacteria bacterium]
MIERVELAPRPSLGDTVFVRIPASGRRDPGVVVGLGGNARSRAAPSLVELEPTCPGCGADLAWIERPGAWRCPECRTEPTADAFAAAASPA